MQAPTTVEGVAPSSSDISEGEDTRGEWRREGWGSVHACKFAPPFFYIRKDPFSLFGAPELWE